MLDLNLYNAHHAGLSFKVLSLKFELSCVLYRYNSGKVLNT